MTTGKAIEELRAERSCRKAWSPVKLMPATLRTLGGYVPASLMGQTPFSAALLLFSTHLASGER